MKPAALALFLAFPLLAQDPHSWGTTDTLFASAYVAASWADWNQTSQIHRYPTLRESNPALGHNPTQAQINRHFVKCTLSDLAVAYLLRKICPAWVSRGYLSCCLAIEAECVRTNLYNGIQIRIGGKF
jgi:hypothetical protein